MTNYIVTALINTTSRFRAYTEDAVLAYDAALVFDVEANTALEAADKVWTIGNRMGADTEGKTWPSWVRSCSVGDVLCIDGQVVMAVESLGFKDLPDFDYSGSWNAPGGRAVMAASGDAAPVEVSA